MEASREEKINAIVDRIYYEINTPLITTSGYCRNGCKRPSRGSGECIKCLEKRLATETSCELAEAFIISLTTTRRSYWRLFE